MNKLTYFRLFRIIIIEMKKCIYVKNFVIYYVVVDGDVLHEIARLVFENGTGARGLRTIL